MCKAPLVRPVRVCGCVCKSLSQFECDGLLNLLCITWFKGTNSILFKLSDNILNITIYPVMYVYVVINRKIITVEKHTHMVQLFTLQRVKVIYFLYQ